MQAYVFLEEIFGIDERQILTKNAQPSRELSLVSATKLRFMDSYPDALALRYANTALVYVPRKTSAGCLQKHGISSLTKKRFAPKNEITIGRM